MSEPALCALSHTEAEYDAIVRQDIELFRDHANRLLAGEITDEDFRPFRLRRGIYSQRQPGVQMIRTKIPGGTLTADQLDQLALVSDRYAAGKGHLTTRQNMQFHFVPLAQVPDLLHLLADRRLTTREACYNTVRNVTACPLSGLLPDEPFDVHPWARRIAFAFLHKELTDNMPRKFKIAFSGCPEDCIGTAFNDVGLRAVIRDGQHGFRMVVGGGLGPLPNEAQLLDEFVPADLLVHKTEAVLRIFNKHGNRQNKNKARLKFIVRERGFDWVKEHVEKEYRDILANGGIALPEEVPESFGGFQAVPPPLGAGRQLPVLNGHLGTQMDPEYGRWLQTNTRPQRQTGYAIVTVKVPQGNLTAHQMRAVADLARGAGDGYVRVSMDQNLMLGFIALPNLKRVYAALRQTDLAEAGAHQIDDVTTCPGAYSCNLALTKSMNLGEAVARAVAGYDDPEVRRLSVRISGCPNSCGQHWTGDVGFYGNARKIDGREVPYYQMLLGGGYDAEGMLRFGLAVQSVPARLAPLAVRRVLDHFIANRLEGEPFRNYVLRHKVETFRAMTADLAKPAETFPEMYRDWGDEEEFSLKLGRGECAA
jgi:sulfite reductase beta subunit-like hemoprotein